MPPSYQRLKTSEVKEDIGSIKVIAGRGMYSHDETIKHFVSGRGKETPLEKVPDNIRESVRKLRTGEKVDETGFDWGNFLEG